MAFNVYIPKQASVWIINQLPAREIHNIIKELPAPDALFFKGFKVSVLNAERKPVKNRLAAEVSHNPELLEDIVLRSSSPWADSVRLLPALDETWLLTYWRNLIVNHGGTFLIAMLTDQRERIRKRAARLFSRSAFWSKDNAPFSGLRVREEPPEWQGLQQFFNKLSGAMDENVYSADEKKQLENANNRLQNEVEKLQQSINKQKQLNASLKESQRQSLETKENKLNRLKEDLRKTRKQKTELQQEFNRRLEGEIQKYRREVLGISTATEKIRQALNESHVDDITSRTRKVLAAQRDLNEKHGTRQALRQRIEELENLEHELEKAATESITVVPELYQLQDQLDEEIQRLKSLLPGENREEAYDYTLRQLLKKARSASLDNNGRTILAGIEELIQEELFREVTDRKSLAALEKTVKERKTYLDKLKKERQIAEGAASYSKRDSATSGEKAREIWKPGEMLTQMAPSQQVVILVDAYNVMKTIDQLDSIIESQGLDRAREEFARMCEKKTTEKKRMELVFDGAEALSAVEKRAGGNLSLIFAARLQESQNADNHIIQRANELTNSGSPDLHILIVTEDYGLRAQTAEICTGFILPRDFFAYLNPHITRGNT